ncbi:branched-chain amino acid ABC transporter permease [Tardiphaga sp. 709]|uniref:branched-chain amino acid ABC transporter permease n=1 Tax=Tardiphaga sp. 709 TaxID=3076039 RepID=UPI0028E4D948|nr:branched-chain amino acid ABC transporter permease [Tardiphaga sp. 709]WNV11757.1 branched-chain amino acid ABC transporter permease [Tardiphaga sp. 709]
MDLTVGSMLAVDGISNGAVYALIGLATVLVFSVTRILFIAQGEFVVFGAITLAQINAGSVPSAIYLLGTLTLGCLLQELWLAWQRRRVDRRLARELARVLLPSSFIIAVTVLAAPVGLPLILQALLSLMLIAPMGMLVYRLIYRSIADASVLTLLIVSVGVHFALVGLGLIFFGPEGYRTSALLDVSVQLGSVPVSGQAIVVIVTALLLISLLFWFSTCTFPGMALRAAAVNRLGARIVGLSSDRAGQTSFILAAAIGALSGILIAPTTTLYYDTGFLIGLKGFVAAVFAGLSSFPGVMIGAIGVGLLESFGSFWSSAFKDSIVFGAVIPVLLLRTILTRTQEDH